jgi:hypothetical protein
MSDYQNVLDPKVNKNLTFTKVNRLIGTVADYPMNLQTSLRGTKWNVVPVIGPDLEIEKQFKLKGTSDNFPITYSSQYQTKK